MGLKRVYQYTRIGELKLGKIDENMKKNALNVKNTILKQEYSGKEDTKIRLACTLRGVWG